MNVAFSPAVRAFGGIQLQHHHIDVSRVCSCTQRHLRSTQGMCSRLLNAKPTSVMLAVHTHTPARTASALSTHGGQVR